MTTTRRLRGAACAVFTVALVSIAAAQALEPFQQEALEKILASMEPALRPMMRAQLEPALAVLDREQVALMLESMAPAESDDEAGDEPYADATASTEDLAYNRAQFEPMIRSTWQAQKRFDEHVDAGLTKHCAAEQEFAVFGLAWRYEVYPLNPVWPKASNDVDLEVEIIGASYAPQDGRYDFDFSEIRLDFDAAAVDRAVAAACAEYLAIGEAFLTRARAAMADSGDAVPPDGLRLQSDANGRVDEVRARLEAVLQAEAPGGGLHMALLNGQPAD